MSEARLILFDCDGTLVDSQHIIVAAMAEAFRESGLEAPSSLAVRRIVGLSLAAAVARLLPDEGRDMDKIFTLVEAYKESFRRMRTQGVEEPLYPGVPEMLKVLAEGGYVLGVATGKSTRGLRSVLRLHGLEDMFMTLQTADDHPGKPDPSMVTVAMLETGAVPETTIVVGDTTYDVEMARAARAHAFGVSWGYHEPDELVAAGALGVFGAVPEIAPGVGRHLLGALS